MADLQEAFYSAASLLGKANYTLEAKYYKFSSLKAILRRNGAALKLKASEGFAAGGREVLVGLCLDLIARLFKQKPPENAYTKAYWEFRSQQGASELNKTLKRSHGRTRKLEAKGNRYDLNDLVLKLTREHPLLQELPVPPIGWNQKGGASILGFYDEATHEILISKELDKKDVPFYVLEYVVFHELLHAKHPSKHNASRRTIHGSAFRKDEERYPFYKEATAWLKRNRIDAYAD